MGIRNARAKNQHPPPAYLMGQTYATGKLQYFPIAILVKTPIPFLILSLTGLALACGRIGKREDPSLYPVLLVVGVATPLLFGMAGHVNIGLRHILSIYPFFAILGAFAWRRFWSAGVAVRYALGGLLLWQVGACVYAAPDFIPYFNEAAAAHADYFLVDSDLDWGQDLKRVGPLLQQLHADRISISYNGTEDLNRAGLPPWQKLEPLAKPSGWIVISDLNLKYFAPAYGWLEQYKPVAKAGHSIFIYHLP